MVGEDEEGKATDAELLGIVVEAVIEAAIELLLVVL
jgi:hypothetical protein